MTPTPTQKASDDANAVSVPHYDMVLRGGEVIDVAGDFQGKADVAIRDGRIAAVGQHIGPAHVAREIDLTGRYVTPGFIDLHTHVFSVMSNCVPAERYAATSGVTTWIDAGSTGGRAVAGFRQYIADPSPVRILAFLNISAIGGVGAPYTYERLEWCDPEIAGAAISAHSGFIIGVKAQMGVPFTARHGLKVLARARETADEHGLPLMVHISWAPPDICDVVKEMRPGDILTHALTGSSMRIVDDEMKLRRCVREAISNGVIIDVGHGGSSFSFQVAEALLKAGVGPDTISTDVHEESIGGPMFDLPTVMSKFLCMGMELGDAVAAVTSVPAKVIGREQELGSLAVGRAADVTCFRVEEGEFRFVDSLRDSRTGHRLIVPEMTLVAGREIPAEAPHPPNPARRLQTARLSRYERIATMLREPPAMDRTAIEDFGPPAPTHRDEQPIHNEPWTS